MNNLIKKWNDTKTIYKIEWVILILILSICYITFNHPDILATSTHGMDLLVTTLKGKFFSFYDYTESTAVYLIPIYIFFAIWSIPVFIIFKIFSIPIWGKLSYFSVKFPLLMWYKLLPVLFCGLTAFILYKIAILMGLKKNKIKWMIFMFLSFPILIFSQFIFGQYDSLCMFFTTLSLYFYLKKDYYKFSLIMSLAITLKLFPIFVFIPLILLVEKRIIHIIKYGLIGMSGYVLSNLLFISSEGFNETKGFTSGMFNRFFSPGINTQFGIVSLFILIFAGTCLFCYMKKIKTNDDFEYYQWTNYIILFVYSLLFMCICWHPQWVLILVPNLILSMFISKNLKISIILNIALSVSYLLLVVSYFTKNVDEILVNYGFLPLVFDKTIPANAMLKGFFSKFSFLNNNVYMTIFFGSLLLNLIIKYPTKNILKENKKEIVKENIEVERGYIWGQILTIFIFIIPTLYLYFFYY